MIIIITELKMWLALCLMGGSLRMQRMTKNCYFLGFQTRDDFSNQNVEPWM